MSPWVLVVFFSFVRDAGPAAAVTQVEMPSKAVCLRSAHDMAEVMQQDPQMAGRAYCISREEALAAQPPLR
jgi:hypothetical protein